MKRKLQAESGVSMIEAALCVPLLLTILVACFDVYNALAVKVGVSKVAYEAFRIATELEALPFTDEKVGKTDISKPRQHQVLHQRIETLINSNSTLRNLQVNYSSHRVNVDPADPDKQNLVRIQINARYPFFFQILPTGENWFNSLMLSKQIEGPYLYLD